VSKLFLIKKLRGELQFSKGDEMMNRRTHIGAYGIVEKDNSILLIQKARGPYTGLLDLPGGTIEFGEAPDGTVVREIDEETGLTVNDCQLVKAASFCFQHNCTSDIEPEEFHHLAFVYKVQCDSTNKIKTDSDGLDSFGAVWVHKDRCDVNKLSPLSKFAVSLIWNT